MPLIRLRERLTEEEEEEEGEHGLPAGIVPVPSQPVAHPSGWLLLGTPDASQCSALVRSPLPPTHWIVCKVSDELAEARGVAAARAAADVPTGLSGSLDDDDADRRRAVRQQLRKWKQRMIDAYSARPVRDARTSKRAWNRA